MKTVKRQINLAIKSHKALLKFELELNDEKRDRYIEDIKKDIEASDEKENKYVDQVREFFEDNNISDEKEYLIKVGVDSSYAWLFGDGSWC